MDATRSEDLQQSAVGEGLAVACPALGVGAVPNSGPDLESAFGHA